MWLLLAIATIGLQQDGPKLPPVNGSEQNKAAPPLTARPAQAGGTLPYPPVAGQKINRPIELSEKAQGFIRSLALIAIPNEFEDDKKWGSTKRVQSGVSVRFEKGKLRTHRKWKNVKHGRWQKYHITLIDPKQKFQLRIANVVKTKEGPYHFDISCIARLRVQGRWQDWRLGVPMLRLTTEADTTVRLDAHCELDFDFDYGAFPPSVQLKPIIHMANVRIGDFKIRRISHLKGRVAEEFSGAIKSVLKRELASRREELPKKLNKKIAKKEDDLKISAGEWLKFAKEDKASSDKKTDQASKQ